MAKIESNLLSDIQLRKWIRGGLPVAKSDGGGLTFTLSSSGTASWVFRFRHGNRRQEVTLGRYPDLSLAAARQAAARKRIGIIDGTNPADEVRKAKANRDWTMRELIADYRKLVFSDLAKNTQLTYGRNLKRIENGMAAMSVQTVGPEDIIAQLERVKAGWSELFTLWMVLRGLFKHAAGKKIIFANPCAGIQLEAVIGKRPAIRRRLMLSEDELTTVMNADMNSANLLAIHILLGTGVRSSELFTALKENVFLDEGRWHIPASKTGPAIDIPLPPVVVGWFHELLEIAGNSIYVLPARVYRRMDRYGGDAHISKDTIREAIDFWVEKQQPDIRRFTPHDLRSTMKSHMRKLGVPRDISEMCLNHKVSGVEGIYDQHNYFEERRAAHELWTNYLVSRLPKTLITPKIPARSITRQTEAN